MLFVQTVLTTCYVLPNNTGNVGLLVAYGLRLPFKRTKLWTGSPCLPCCSYLLSSQTWECKIPVLLVFPPHSKLPVILCHARASPAALLSWGQRNGRQWPCVCQRKNAQLTRDLTQIILQFTQMRDESQCCFPSQYSVMTRGHKTASINLLWGCPQTHSSTGCLPCWFLRGLGMQTAPLGLYFAPTEPWSPWVPHIRLWRLKY